MPNQFQTRLVYNSLPSNTGAIGATGVYQLNYHGNDVYDPYAGAGGYDCRGRAELGYIYNKYKVIGSRITVLARDQAGTVSQKHVSVYPTLDVTDITSKIRALTTPQQAQAAVPNDGTEAKIVHYARTAAVYAVKDIDDVGFHAAVNASPNFHWYWKILFTGESDDNINYRVILEYYVIWYDLRQVTPSSL